MHRLLVASEALKLDSPELPKEAANHLKVLRPKDGEEIELFDGRGAWRVYQVGVESWSGRVDFKLSPVVGDVTSKHPNIQTSKHPNIQTSKRPNALTLFACVTKGSRWDWTIEKATELGVTRIVPVISERTIVRIPKEDRAAKCERWRRIAEDAARQSDAKWLPEILEPVDFADSLELVKETQCFVGALANPPPRMILDELAREGARRTEGEAREGARRTEGESREGARRTLERALFVGPEGDFTPDELNALIAIATPVSFGPTILRAETAAIFGMSVLAAFAATR